MAHQPLVGQDFITGASRSHSVTHTTHGRVLEQRCSFTLSFTSALYGGGLSTPCPPPLYSRKGPVTHCAIGWVGATPGEDGCGEWPAPRFHRRTFRSVPSRYTHYATPAHESVYIKRKDIYRWIFKGLAPLVKIELHKTPSNPGGDEIFRPSRPVLLYDGYRAFL